MATEPIPIEPSQRLDPSYQWYHGFVRVARFWIGKSGLSENPQCVISEAWLRARRKAAKTDDDLLWAIRWTVLDGARKQRAHAHISLTAIDSCDAAPPTPSRGKHLALGDALHRLTLVDSRAATIVKLRFYNGLSENEVGAELGISVITVRRDWTFARDWLRQALSNSILPG